MKTLFLFLLFSSIAFGFGNNFSCSYGQQGACLDYGDKICSSMAKCVDSSAICFSSYTCDYKGFVCKSKFDDLIDEYDSLLRKSNNLVEEYNNLKNDYDDLLYKNRKLKNCVDSSSTIDEAKYCY